jgi:hypothetical protein
VSDEVESIVAANDEQVEAATTVLDAVSELTGATDTR